MFVRLEAAQIPCAPSKIGKNLHTTMGLLKDLIGYQWPGSVGDASECWNTPDVFHVPTFTSNLLFITATRLAPASRAAAPSSAQSGCVEAKVMVAAAIKHWTRVSHSKASSEHRYH